MPGTNDFLPFATGGSPTVLSQASYAALSARGTGFQAGVAEPAQLNKVWRQSAFVAHIIGRFIAEVGEQNALDDTDGNALLAAFVQSLSSGVGGIPRGITVYSTPGSHNYTVPANTYRIRIKLVGGGGGGGGNTTSGSAGGGGGGGYVEKIVAVSPGDVLALVVGSGGTAGSNAGPTAADNNGGAGVASTYVAGSLSAGGGSGGFGSVSTGQGNSGPGGIGSGGDLNIVGQDGNASFSPTGAGYGGFGGSSVLGGGGASSSGLPASGNSYGGGGAGGAGNFGGAVGASGVVIVEH